MEHTEHLKKLNRELFTVLASLVAFFMVLMSLLYFASNYMENNASNTTSTEISQVIQKTEEQKRFDIIEKCYDKSIIMVHHTARTENSVIKIRSHCAEIYKNNTEEPQSIK